MRKERNQVITKLENYQLVSIKRQGSLKRMFQDVCVSVFGNASKKNFGYVAGLWYNIVAPKKLVTDQKPKFILLGKNGKYIANRKSPRSTVDYTMYSFNSFEKTFKE